MGKYDAYTDLDRPVSKKHGCMPRENRAKQFAPFAAVKGHSAAIRAKEKVIVSKVVLGEDAAELLDRKLSQVKKNDIITAVYYSEEDLQYLQVTGMVSRIDPVFRVLQVVGTEISLENLFDIRIEKRKE